jgi:hypothetical protein
MNHMVATSRVHSKPKNDQSNFLTRPDTSQKPVPKQVRRGKLTAMIREETSAKSKREELVNETPFRIATPDLEIEAQVHAAGIGLINTFASDLFSFIDKAMARKEGPDWLVKLQAMDLTVGEINYRDPAVLLKELAIKGQSPLRKPVSAMVPAALWKDFYKRLEEVLGERHLWVHNSVKADTEQLKALVVLINKVAWHLELPVVRECGALLELMNPEEIDELEELDEPQTTPSDVVPTLGAFTKDDEAVVGSAVPGPFASYSYTLHVNGSIRNRSTDELLEVLIASGGTIGALLIARKPSGGRLRITTDGTIAAYFGEAWGFLAKVTSVNWFPGHLA